MSKYIGKAESDRLEFKREFWTGSGWQEELAKDLAAFANHRGGTVVVGLHEKDEVALGHSGVSFKKQPEQRIRQALHRHCWPQEAVQVSVEHNKSPEGELLVIDVEPWAHGVVAVRSGQNLHLHRFPVRRGAHTQEMPMSEVLERYGAGRRRHALRFARWAEEQGALGIYWQSAVNVETLQHELLPIPTEPRPGPWAQLGRVSDDGFEVRLLRTAFCRSVGFEAARQGGNGIELSPELGLLFEVAKALSGGEVWQQVGTKPRLVVPYEVVRAAWMDRGTDGERRLHLLLDVDLVLGTNGWRLRAGRG